MQKSSLVALFVVFLTGVCHSQELNDPFSQSQGVSQGASQGSIDCSDPSMAESPTCSGAQGQRGNTAPSGEFPSSTMRTPTLNTPYGFTPDQYRSEEHTSELQSPCNTVCRLLLEKKYPCMQAIPM